MRSVRLASLLVGAGLFLAACGDNGTADSDGGTDGGADGGDARVPDATVDARPPDSSTADAGLPQPKLVDSDNTTSAIRPRIAVNASGRALAIWLTGCTTTTDPSSTGTATLSMCTEVWGNAFISGNWGNATKLTSGVGGIRAGSSLEYPDVAIDTAGSGVGGLAPGGRHAASACGGGTLDRDRLGGPRAARQQHRPRPSRPRRCWQWHRRRSVGAG